MSADDKIIITADQAIDLLPEGEYVHNYANPGINMLVGCDYTRPDAIEALRSAKLIEIGGEQCKAMRHPIVAHDATGRYTFFEADMAKVEALEKARAADLSHGVAS